MCASETVIKLVGKLQMPSSNNLWPFVLGNWILPVGDLFLGQGMMRHFRYLEKAQWWDAERIHKERDAKLQKLIKVAYREVPFYRELMSSANVQPEDVKSPADLQKIPVATKEMFLENHPHKTVRPTNQKHYEARTSGSTGKNFTVVEDAETAGTYRACTLMALQWSGWNLGVPHLQTGMTLNRSTDRKLKDSLMSCHYYSAFDLTDKNLDRWLETIERNKLRHVFGYPGSIYCLARRAIQKGFSETLKSVVTWGDTLYHHYRETMEKAFKVRVYDTYGCGEGIQISAQCGIGSNYHIHALDTIVEFLNDDGVPATPGETANLIITRLHPGPMPLIRYRIGDIGISSAQNKCECGRGFDLMHSIQGRDTDIVYTPDGNKLIVHFFTGVLEHFHEVDSFQVVQDSIDSILIRMVLNVDLTKELHNRIVKSLQEKGATGFRIDLETVSDIPISATGKRRFIVSNVSKSNITSNVV
jgi:phenylacetate-CoA ligase